MDILLWIIFGGLAGWIASLIVGADASLGILGNIIVGIVGAFIGGWIADRMTPQEAHAAGMDSSMADRPTTFWSFVWAVIGAIILLVVLNLIFQAF